VKTYSLWTKDGWSEPVEEAQLRTWIASGEVAPKSFVKGSDGQEGLAEDLLAPPPPALPPAQVSAPKPAPQDVPARVTVVDFDMSFGNMVIFMFKWTLAAIPALILLGGLAIFAMLILSAFGAAILR
jgi:hypothetical protein